MFLSFMSSLLWKTKQVRDKLYFQVHPERDVTIDDKELYEKWMFMEDMYDTISSLSFYYNRLKSTIKEEQNNK